MTFENLRPGGAWLGLLVLGLVAGSACESDGGPSSAGGRGGYAGRGGRGSNGEGGEAGSAEGGTGGSSQRGGRGGRAGGNDALGGRNGGSGASAGKGATGGDAGPSTGGERNGEGGSAAEAGEGVGGEGVGGGGAGGGGAGGAAGSSGLGGTAGAVQSTRNAFCDESSGRVACYTGPTGTLGVGLCASGCERSGSDVCSGQILPSAESCNGEDDDCNGIVDDAGSVSCGFGVCERTIAACSRAALAICTPGAPLAVLDGCGGGDEDCDGSVDEDCADCFHVAPDGDDAAALVSGGALAFRNVQPALDFAQAHPDIATRVCVASGATCAGPGTTYAGPVGSDLTMHDGVDLLGGYESTTWTRCAVDLRAMATRLAPATGLGVLFPASISNDTRLDGFGIERAEATTTAGVTVDGADAVHIANVSILSAPPSSMSYGVHIVNGGDADIVLSRVYMGIGTAEGYALRATDSRVRVRQSWLGAVDAIQRSGGKWLAVLLENSPGSTIDDSELNLDLRAGPGYNTSISSTVSALKITGNSEQTAVSRSTVHATLGCPSYYDDLTATSIDACGGAAVRLADNDVAIDCSDMYDTDCSGTCNAIRSGAGCSTVVEANEILATSVFEATAIDCTGGSACVIADNPSVVASAHAHSQYTTSPDERLAHGIRCAEGSCARITNNEVLGNQRRLMDYHLGFEGFGIWLGSSHALVSGNRVRAGCSEVSVGLWATGNARIENNVFVGASEDWCGRATDPRGLLDSRTVFSVGMHVRGDVDVHSNVIHGGTVCHRLSFGLIVLAYPDGRGSYRNNVIHPGACASAGILLQSVESGTLGAFEHNNVVPTGLGRLASVGPYHSESELQCRSGPSDCQFPFQDHVILTTAAQLDSLSQPAGFGNIAVEPNFASDGYHLLADSACIDAGTSRGAPPADIDGESRDETPDIGVDER
jgi:hypothetical protein